MKFKEYLNEKSGKILHYIRNSYLPLTPKFFEEVFGKKEKICFIAHDPRRHDSIIKRQYKKNQLSTFTDFKSPKIFWGANGLDIYDASIVSILKGNITFQGPTDMWSLYTEQGRRWIGIDAILDSASLDKKDTKLFENLKNDLEYSKFLIYAHKNGCCLEIEYASRIYDSELDNKQKQLYIKLYFDFTYDILKKYKKEILNLSSLTGDYNEILCYNYEILESYMIFSKDLAKDDIKFYTDFANKNNIKLITEKELIKILNKYKAKNDI